ncbi:MAG: diacylglycerol kinase family protein [Candidatus Omnitrophota bacterium]|nr:MAG: diacylglycerol kinase family protein [Candidatus Omnitrophota bacterium]
MFERPWRHRSILQSIIGALKGLHLVIKTERNAKIIAALGALAIAAGFILQISLLEFIIVIIVITIVFAFETFNTITEILLDLIIPDKDPHVKILKDIASGTVLIATISAVVIGVIIFLPKILTLLGIKI